MDIHVNQSQTQIKIDPITVQNLVAEFISFAKISYDEAAIHFVNTQTICKLHAEYFNNPSMTDCISFPIDDDEADGYRVMGDVFVCPQAAVDYVKTYGGDVYEELTLYVIHGLLHLIGYDDIEEIDRLAMREAEAIHLDNIKKKGIWLHS